MQKKIYYPSGTDKYTAQKKIENKIANTCRREKDQKVWLEWSGQEIVVAVEVPFNVVLKSIYKWKVIFEEDAISIYRIRNFEFWYEFIVALILFCTIVMIPLALIYAWIAFWSPAKKSRKYLYSVLQE